MASSYFGDTPVDRLMQGFSVGQSITDSLQRRQMLIDQKAEREQERADRLAEIQKRDDEFIIQNLGAQVHDHRNWKKWTPEQGEENIRVLSEAEKRRLGASQTTSMPDFSADYMSRLQDIFKDPVNNNIPDDLLFAQVQSEFPDATMNDVAFNFNNMAGIESSNNAQVASDTTAGKKPSDKPDVKLASMSSDSVDANTTTANPSPKTPFEHFVYQRSHYKSQISANDALDFVKLAATPGIGVAILSQTNGGEETIHRFGSIWKVDENLWNTDRDAYYAEVQKNAEAYDISGKRAKNAEAMTRLLPKMQAMREYGTPAADIVNAYRPQLDAMGWTGDENALVTMLDGTGTMKVKDSKEIGIKRDLADNTITKTQAAIKNMNDRLKQGWSKLSETQRHNYVSEAQGDERIAVSRFAANTRASYAAEQVANMQFDNVQSIDKSIKDYMKQRDSLNNEDNMVAGKDGKTLVVDKDALADYNAMINELQKKKKTLGKGGGKGGNGNKTWLHGVMNSGKVSASDINNFKAAGWDDARIRKYLQSKGVK